jgi:C4-dicarboxylate transporter DctQ subunit
MLRALDRAEEWLTATLLAAMTLLTFLQVVLRYGFNSGLIWSLETTVYLFTWVSGVIRPALAKVRNSASLNGPSARGPLPRNQRRADMGSSVRSHSR